MKQAKEMAEKAKKGGPLGMALPSLCQKALY